MLISGFNALQFFFIILFRGYHERKRSQIYLKSYWFLKADILLEQFTNGINKMKDKCSLNKI